MMHIPFNSDYKESRLRLWNVAVENNKYQKVLLNGVMYLYAYEHTSQFLSTTQTYSTNIIQTIYIKTDHVKGG